MAGKFIPELDPAGGTLTRESILGFSMEEEERSYKATIGHYFHNQVNLNVDWTETTSDGGLVASTTSRFLTEISDAENIKVGALLLVPGQPDERVVETFPPSYKRLVVESSAEYSVASFKYVNPGYCVVDDEGKKKDIVAQDLISVTEGVIIPSIGDVVLDNSSLFEISEDGALICNRYDDMRGQPQLILDADTTIAPDGVSTNQVAVPLGASEDQLEFVWGMDLSGVKGYLFTDNIEVVNPQSDPFRIWTSSLTDAGIVFSSDSEQNRILDLTSLDEEEAVKIKTYATAFLGDVNVLSINDDAVLANTITVQEKVKTSNLSVKGGTVTGIPFYFEESTPTWSRYPSYYFRCYQYDPDFSVSGGYGPVASPQAAYWRDGNSRRPNLLGSRHFSSETDYDLYNFVGVRLSKKGAYYASLRVSLRGWKNIRGIVPFKVYLYIIPREEPPPGDGLPAVISELVLARDALTVDQELTVYNSFVCQNFYWYDPDEHAGRPVWVVPAIHTPGFPSDKSITFSTQEYNIFKVA